MNLQAHNLCTTLKPPKHFRFLLGLGLRFCIKRTSTTSTIKEYTKRFERDLFIKSLFNNDDNDTTAFDPRLYVKSNYQVNPLDVSVDLRIKTSTFITHVSRHFTRKPTNSNLLPTQRNILETLSRSDKLFIIRTDKNLGPAVIERDEYIKRAYTDHLSDTVTYRRLTHSQALLRVNTVTLMIKRFLNRFRTSLRKADHKFIATTLSKCKDPFGHFYILAKIHKSPWSTRPICSVSGSLLHGLGKWVDVQLQPICARLPTFLSSSFNLKDQLDELDELPLNAKLFTADAVSMYTNINTRHALEVISNFVRTHPLCRDIDPDPLLQALNIVMTHNLVQFGDTYWVQLTGTAMGTPPAPMYATLYFAIKEFDLLSDFADSIFFYKRYIDDVFGIWVPSTDPTALTFDQLESAMTFGDLTWVVNPLSTSVVFLDVTISLLPSHRLDIRLYEKALNLYLYLPPNSAHPPGVLKGLIIGLLLRIVRLTSDSSLHSHLCSQVFHRLRARGYSYPYLKPLFDKALQYIAGSKSSPPVLPGPVQKPLSIFLHLPFHPRDVQSRVIQALFRQVFNTEPIQSSQSASDRRLIIAYHRPPNLGNILCPRRISKTPGPPVSDVLSKLDICRIDV
jgi:hypothetical protein